MPHAAHPTSPPSPRVDRDHNEVHLTGRVSGPATRRSLPSGDEVVTFRLVVAREEPDAPVDTFDVTVGPAPPAGARRRPGQVGRRLLRAAEVLEDGQRLTVAGVLRRRWWRTGAAPQSRIEVHARSLS
jgi:single-strand DNA-binding protein